jgi:predicted transposase/invertase (TIGR01784 family)
MSDPVHQPHDKLFKLGFSDPASAAAFLRTQLDPDIADVIDWSAPELQPGSFIDSHLVGSESDLLFATTLARTPCRLYLLFEHQSTEDRWLALRLLRYFVRIWEKHRALQPETSLPVIVPVVLAQNAQVWTLPETFGALVGAGERTEPAFRSYVPDFRFHLVQLAELPYDRLLGTPAGVIALRVLKAERVGELLGDDVWDEALLSQTSAEFLQIVWRYLVTAAAVDLEQFRRRILRVVSPAIRDQTMTLAEQLRREGRLEGRQEGRLAALHDNILEALTVRFGDVPEAAREAVIEIADESRLRELLREAIRTPTLDAFAATVTR